MRKLLLFSFLITIANAGDFDPAAGQPGSLAIPLDDSRIRSWANGIHDYQPGDDVDEVWQTPQNALGPASGDPFDILCLGRGGSITFSWAAPLFNGPGPDIAIFENSFSDRFLELAHVEVSSDGENWQRFPSISQTPSPVGSFGITEPTNVSGLAGKYRATFGTGFDFADLPQHPHVDRDAIRFIRLVDVVGNGTDPDSLGNPIYDPYPTFGSAGFDLDGLAVLSPPPLTLLDSKVDGSNLTFSWAVEAGKSYVVERASDLRSSSWDTIFTATLESPRFDFVAPQRTGEFFRLREHSTAADLR
ncbi:MAG: PEP-CTERM sorting domain-containing protein [Akkermansiaceae bacterium]